jgi:hypothetical protein
MIGMAALALLGAALVGLLVFPVPWPGRDRHDDGALFGEARQGGLTVPLREAIQVFGCHRSQGAMAGRLSCSKTLVHGGSTPRCSRAFPARS